MNIRLSHFNIIDKPYKIILFSFLLTFFGLFIAWSSVKIWIKTEANKIAQEAVIEYQSDNTESLLMMIFDDQSNVEEKNMAIWALGTLKAEQALEDLIVLDSMITDEDNFGISRYELQKAILKIKGDFKGSWKVSQK
ncbi:MAG: hypothetical protein ACP5E3_02730 [Bacteroidales bacterium]